MPKTNPHLLYAVQHILITVVPMTLVFIGAFAAGWIDAVIGGGGLVLIPLLLSQGLAPTTALATNKLAACSGTVSASLVLIRNVGMPRNIWRFIPVALICSGLGALVASAMSAAIMRPIIIVLLLLVGIFVAFRPEFGTRKTVVRARTWLAVCCAGAIAFYDGVFGPGTGMFLIAAFTALLTGDFLASSVLAKVVNVCTNLGALCVFILGGHVWWTLGLGLALANILGGILGAKTAVLGGSKFIRLALLAMVVVLVARLTLVS